MNILVLHNNTGSRFYRLIPQLKWMQEKGHKVLLERNDTPHIDEKIAWSDLVIFQMVFSEEVVDVCRAMGKKVVFECDDLIHKTHELHHAYEETRGWKGWRFYYRVWRVLRKCDGFISSNENLRKKYGWMTKRTLVFPNYLSLEHWLKEPKKNLSTDRVRILWAGSTSHTIDLNFAQPIIKEILARYPQVQFIYVGHGGIPTDDLYARFIYGEDLFKDLPQSRRESVLAVPPNVWPYRLAAMQADIAIAPLEKIEFNRYKTQCKYLEYAVNGIPGVYSSWFYTDVKDGMRECGEERHVGSDKKHILDSGIATGLLADTPEEWIAALSLLIENATLRKRIGENARKEAIEKYNIAPHLPEWQAFLESIYGTTRINDTRSPSLASQTQVGGERQ